ncbi:MAG: DUF4214 domain-containing protein [Clostridiales bacterium]|nr:DUF4214 domain-containing protein [Clostridiales bacterium]
MFKKRLLVVAVAVAVIFTIITSPLSSKRELYADDEITWSYDVENFVRGLYWGCLGREADWDGLTYWCRRLATGEITGKQAAYGFFYSREFLLSLPTMTEQEVINRYYNVFLGRWAEPEGLDYWTLMLQSGGGPDELFAGFADSQEFLGRCEAAGVNAGPHINVPNVTSYWGPYSTGFNLMRLRRGYPIDEVAVIGSIQDQCNYWTWLEYTDSPDALHYYFGGKALKPGGGIDCSGFVTAIYRRAFGTQSIEYGDMYDGNIYLSSHNYMGYWGAGFDRSAPTNEGVYYTNGDPGRPIYVDRYGMASAYAMNTYQWHYYLDYLGMTGNSYLTWRVSDYTQEQLEQMLNLRGFKPGDIVIWYTSAVDGPHSEHIGIYAGNGYVWHCTSMITDGAQYTPISFMGSYEDTTIQYCRIYHMT